MLPSPPSLSRVFPSPPGESMAVRVVAGALLGRRALKDGLSTAHDLSCSGQSGVGATTQNNTTGLMLAFRSAVGGRRRSGAVAYWLGRPCQTAASTGRSISPAPMTAWTKSPRGLPATRTSLPPVPKPLSPTSVKGKPSAISRRATLGGTRDAERGILATGAAGCPLPHLRQPCGVLTTALPSQHNGRARCRRPGTR